MTHGSMLDTILFADWFRWLFIAVVVVVAWHAWRKDVRRMANTFRLMGVRLENARVHLAPWSIAYPTLTFRYKGCEVAVTASQGSKRHTPKTYFTVTLPRPVPFQMKLWREHVVEKIGKAMGAKDIQVGDEKLDKAFLVRGDDEAMVRTVLNSKLRAALLWFRGLEPWVTINGREVEVYICTIPNHRKLYERFFALGRLLTDAVVDAVG